MIESSNINVTVIIPTYYDWDRLALCLKALDRQSYPSENFEIIVVNNAPEDSTPKRIKLAENSKIITEAKPGSYSARNTAIKIAKGKYIFFTDSDCIPDKNWIRSGVDYFLKNTEITRIGGKTEVFPKITNHPTIIELHDILYAFRYKVSLLKSGACVTANLAAHKSLFKTVGLFDETLKSGGDFEWNIRSQKKGSLIHYNPAMLVLHPARESYKELKKKSLRVVKGYFESKGKYQSRIQFIFNFIKRLKPSVGIFLLTLKSKKDSLPRRIYTYWFVYYRLELVKALELIKYRMKK